MVKGNNANRTRRASMKTISRILTIPLAIVVLLNGTPAFAQKGGNSSPTPAQAPVNVTYQCDNTNASGVSFCFFPEISVPSDMRLVIEHVLVRTFATGNPYGIVNFKYGTWSRSVHLPVASMSANGRTYLERSAPLYVDGLSSVQVFGASPNVTVFVELTGYWAEL
jgi:hypothetical protein